MRIVWVTAALFLMTALAGCSGGGGGDGAPEDADFKELDLQASDTKGLIRGVVVDEAIRPLAGAKVSLQTPSGPREAVASENGLFGFDDLDPGTYFLAASKAGFKTAQTSTEVVAGVAEPKVVRVLLSPDASFVAPYFEQFVFEGFIECSVGAAVDAGNYGVENACSESVDTPAGNVEPFSNSATFVEHAISGVPTWVQSETVWQSTQAASSSLSFNYAYRDDGELDGFKDNSIDGQSPLVHSMDAETAAEYAGNGTLTLRVFPWTDQYPGVVLAVEQKFTTYTHVFYGYQPPEGWTFGGASVVPPPPQ